MDNNNLLDFNAEKFVDFLLDEGSQTTCDETSESFNRCEALPDYYDEKLYRKGQTFFHRNIFALFYGKLMGLLTVLTIPSILKILMHTQMSGNPMTAYKRYMSTIFHMCIWYQSDFTPGSKLWESIKDVKSRHNSASKKGCASGLHRINQKDMALTQFGFMGFAIVRREQIGLYNIKPEEWKAFIHVWRVVGHAMGIEDRFNICRESVEETTAICRILIDRVFRIAIRESKKDFYDMARYLVEGIWAMNPTLEFNTYLVLLNRLLQQDVNSNTSNEKIKLPYVKVGIVEKFHLWVHYWVTWSLQFAIFRLWHNNVQFLALWTMKVFPFLAYYSFGRQNSHIDILPNHIKAN